MKRFIYALLFAATLGQSTHADQPPRFNGRDVVIYGLEALRSFLDGRKDATGMMVALGFVPWHQLYQREVEDEHKLPEQFFREAEVAITAGLTLTQLIKRVHPDARVDVEDPTSLIVAVSSFDNFSREREVIEDWLSTTAWDDCPGRLGEP